VLGGFLSLLSAATFAFETVTARRGVLTASVTQAMAITVPLGVPIFFLFAAAFGALGTIAILSTEAIAYLAAAGVLHFVWGRYCNYRASKAMGADNLKTYALVMACYDSARSRNTVQPQVWTPR